MAITLEASERVRLAEWCQELAARRAAALSQAGASIEVPPGDPDLERAQLEYAAALVIAATLRGDASAPGTVQ